MPTPDNYITREEFASWLQSPITRIVSASRKADVAKLQQEMSAGGTFDANSVESTALNTAFRVGYILGLSQAFDPPPTIALQMTPEFEDDDGEAD